MKIAAPFRRRLAGAIVAGFVITAGAGMSQKPPAGQVKQDEAAFRAVCGSCHDTSMVSGFLSEPEWVETIDVMRGLGAKGTEDQFAAVRRYLLRNNTKVNVNTQSAAEIAPVLEIGESAATALVTFREAKGPFKTLDDLKKVPGMDPAKVDERRDRIAFR